MVFEIIPIAIIGLASAIFVELLKIFPLYSRTKERKRLTALVVSFIFAALYLFSLPEFSPASSSIFILAVISATFVIYKAVVQTIVEPIRIKLKAL